MKKSTVGVVVGSVVAGTIGGAMAMHKNKVRKAEETNATQRVNFHYFGKQGVKETLGGMQTEEIVELSKALDIVNSFEVKVNSVRREALQSIVKSSLGLDYDDFLTKLLTVYSSEAEVLNTSYSKLIDDYYTITGENIDSDDNEEFLKELDKVYSSSSEVELNDDEKECLSHYSKFLDDVSVFCDTTGFAGDEHERIMHFLNFLSNPLFEGDLLNKRDENAVEDNEWEDGLETEGAFIEPDSDFMNKPE